MPRKPLSKKTRFEVFKRDDFTCQYCGKKVPTVVLEVDHIVPLKEGGSDEMENLIAACEACNQGKGARPLESVAQVVDAPERARVIREREEQLRALNEVHAERAMRVERDYNAIIDYWYEVWGENELYDYQLPFEGTIRRYLDLLPLEMIKEAVRVTLRKMKNGYSRRYFAGVLKHTLAEYEGRLVECKYCNQWIVLDPGEDGTVEWWHKKCREEHDAGE